MSICTGLKQQAGDGMGEKKERGRFTLRFNEGDPIHETAIGLLELQSPRTKAQYLTISSFIQTILLVLELHQIVRFTLADFTANREFHPAPKTLLFSCFLAIITSTTFGSNELKKVRKHFGNHLILSYSFSYETKSVSGILRWSCLSVSAASSFP